MELQRPTRLKIRRKITNPFFERMINRLSHVPKVRGWSTVVSAYGWLPKERLAEGIPRDFVSACGARLWIAFSEDHQSWSHNKVRYRSNAEVWIIEGYSRRIAACIQLWVTARLHHNKSSTDARLHQ